MNGPVAQTVWTKSLDSVAQAVGQLAFRTWFTPLAALSMVDTEEGKHLLLESPSTFHSEWVESHYGTMLQEMVSSVTGGATRIRFHARAINDLFAEDDRPLRPASSAEPVEKPAGEIPVNQTRQPARIQVSPATFDSGLNGRYTFDRFVEGDCNRLARSAAMAVAERPGQTSFNPYMIYGGVGLGKTHLVQAIGNYAAAHRTAERIRYVSTEQFTSEFVSSIKRNGIGEFTSFYRSVDLLILDDVQFLGGKEKTQEEFFHVFNELHRQGKQLILCADRSPKDISGIEDRLLSRFLWGLSTEIQAPGFETRRQIVKRLAESHGQYFSDDTYDYVAGGIDSNIRELEGAFTRVIAASRLQREPLSQSAIQSLLRDYIRTNKGASITVEEIQNIVARFYHVPQAMILGKSKKREIATARQVAMFLSKQHTGLTLSAIGNRFGGRDHSTVVHACSAVQDRLDVEPSFREELKSIRRQIKD